jgi:hypothetical protein
MYKDCKRIQQKHVRANHWGGGKEITESIFFNHNYLQPAKRTTGFQQQSYVYSEEKNVQQKPPTCQHPAMLSAAWTAANT